MVDFISDNIPIQASRKRVVALSKGAADKIAVKSTSKFSGTVVLVTIFTVSAHYQYHLVFLDNSYKSVEIWHFDIPKISHCGAHSVEKDIMGTIQQLGLQMSALSSDSLEFQTMLARLPMAFDDDNATPLTGFCVKAPEGTGSKNQKGDAEDKVPGISKEAKKALSDFFIQF